MIKHLSPRTNEEIAAAEKDEIVSIALAKLPEYPTACNTYYIYVNPPSYEKAHIFYKLTFTRYNVSKKWEFNHKWELTGYEIHQHELLHREWFGTKNVSDVEMQKRPYD